MGLLPVLVIVAFILLGASMVLYPFIKKGKDKKKINRCVEKKPEKKEKQDEEESDETTDWARIETKVVIIGMVYLWIVAVIFPAVFIEAIVTFVAVVAIAFSIITRDLFLDLWLPKREKSK
jgi:uncharacterized ion transporter superfamily protein YfcC